VGHEIVGQAGEQGAAGQPAMAAGAEGAIGPGLKGIEGTFEAEAFDEKAKRVLMFNVLPTSSAGELSPTPITLPTSFTFSPRSTPSRKHRGPTPIAR
jgi:hypothetical protein